MGSRLGNRCDPQSVARGGLCSAVTAARGETSAEYQNIFIKIYSVEIMANNGRQTSWLTKLTAADQIDLFLHVHVSVHGVNRFFLSTEHLVIIFFEDFTW
jgi:hypothetical protein